MKKIFFSIVAISMAMSLFSQTKEELVAKMNLKKDSIATIKKRVDKIQGEINALPGWRTGAFGTIGGSIANFNNWYTQAIPNNSTGRIGFTFNTFANLRQENYFWRNTMNVNLGWVKLDDLDDETDSEKFDATTDVFQITSLFGLNVTPKLAISTLAEYRTTVINDFNNPGYLDIGIGATWTPIDDLIVVVHPLNYNFVFSEEENIYESSLGAKIVADYTKKIGEVSFKSNVTSFVSYENSDLDNVTWTNGLSYQFLGSFGVGFDFALRSNKQEALDYSINALGNVDETFETVDNELQSFWILGLSYSF